MDYTLGRLLQVGPQWPLAYRLRYQPATDCWRWTGARDRNGYARVGNTPVHRVFRALLLDPTYTYPTEPLDNLCGHRDCVNPLHWAERTGPEPAPWPGDPLDVASVKAEHLV